MSVIITARHCELPDQLRDRAEEVAERLESRSGRSAAIDIIFDVDAGIATAEILFRTSRLDPFVAAGQGDDHRSALDQAEARLRRQLEKPGTRRLRGRKPTEMDNV